MHLHVLTLGCPLTLLLDRGSAAQLRALHNQLAREGHEFLHAANTKHWRLSLRGDPALRELHVAQ